MHYITIILTKACIKLQLHAFTKVMHYILQLRLQSNALKNTNHFERILLTTINNFEKQHEVTKDASICNNCSVFK